MLLPLHRDHHAFIFNWGRRYFRSSERSGITCALLVNTNISNDWTIPSCPHPFYRSAIEAARCKLYKKHVMRGGTDKARQWQVLTFHRTFFLEALMTKKLPTRFSLLNASNNLLCGANFRSDMYDDLKVRLKCILNSAGQSNATHDLCL